MSAATPEVPEPPRDGAIDPALLRLIQRVAHREHLLDGVPAPAHSRSNAPTRSTRRRPAIGTARTSVPVRPTRGTTARKVTWS